MFFSGLIAITSIIARYARFLGLSVASVGLVFSLAPLASAVSRIPVGVGADRVGARPFMVLGSVWILVSGLVAAASHSILGVALARALQGLGLAFFVAPSIFAASVIPGVSASRAISARSAAIALASSISPFISGVLVDHYGYAAGFLYGSANGGLAALLSALLFLEKPVEKTRRSTLLREALSSARSLWAIVPVAPIIDGAVFMGFQSLPQAELRDLGYPAAVFGLALALNGLAGFPSRLSVSRLASRYGCPMLMLAGYASIVTGLGVLRISVAPPAIYLVGALYGAGFGLVAPSEQLLIVTNTPRAVRNTVLSIYTLGFDAGGFIGSTLLGALASGHGYSASYTAMMIMEVLSASIVLAWSTTTKKLRTRQQK